MLGEQSKKVSYLHTINFHAKINFYMNVTICFK